MARRWSSLKVAFAALPLVGCMHARVPLLARTPPAPTASEPPVSEPVATPGASPSQPPSPLFKENTELSIGEIPINAGPRSNLFYYDPRLGDMIAVYAAGPDVENPSFFDNFRRLMFDQDGKIYAWDLALDAKEAPEAVDQIPDVADPVWNASGSVMVFHNPANAYLFVRFDQPAMLDRITAAARTADTALAASRSIATPSPSVAGATKAGGARTSSSVGTSPAATPAAKPASFPTAAPPTDASSGVWLQGQVFGFPKIAAVGALHGGIADAHIDSAATEVAFITGDGGLYLYGILAGTLYQATAANRVGDGRVEEMALCPAGSPIAFRSGGHLFLYFLQSGSIDPMPYANAVDSAVRAYSPLWVTNQEFWYLLDLPDGRTLFARYNWLTETVRTAFFFNVVLGGGFQTLSAP